MAYSQHPPTTPPAGATAATTNTTTTSYLHYRAPRPSVSEPSQHLPASAPKKQAIPVFDAEVPEHLHHQSNQPNRHHHDLKQHPWTEMGHTYLWVAEQDFMRTQKRSMKTEDWVREQQRHYVRPSSASSSSSSTPSPSPSPSPSSSPSPPSSVPRYATGGAPKPRRSRTTSRPTRQPSTHHQPPQPQHHHYQFHHNDWEEVLYVYEIDADDIEWARQEERARRLALERERARARIQEEVKRIEAKFEQKRQAERRAREESRKRGIAELREREKRERARMEKAIVDAWTRYESRWSALAASGDTEMDFKSIPWPTAHVPRSVQDITPEAIVGFLFSPLHSESLSRKDRLKSALLRWHPDRFRRVLGRVKAEDKAVVEEGVGIVARCLNSLMEQEKSK